MPAFSKPRGTETPAGLRDMAARARRLVQGVGDQQTIANLTAFAAELEAQATALETAPQTAQQSDPDISQN